MPSESMKKLLTLAMLGASMKKETPMPSEITAERDAAVRERDAIASRARLLINTLDAHSTETLDCDRSGQKYCDCLERNTKDLRAILSTLPEVEIKTEEKKPDPLAEAVELLNLYVEGHDDMAGNGCKCGCVACVRSRFVISKHKH